MYFRYLLILSFTLISSPVYSMRLPLFMGRTLLNKSSNAINKMQIAKRLFNHSPRPKISVEITLNQKKYAANLNTHAGQCTQLWKETNDRVKRITTLFNWTNCKKPIFKIIDSKEEELAGINIRNSAILINFDRFASLTDKEKDFHLAHEIGHYQQFINPSLCDKIKQIISRAKFINRVSLCSLALFGSCELFPSAALFNQELYGISIGLTAGVLISCSISRNIEYAADKRAAKALKSANGVFLFLIKLHPY